jgi:hypothetical protein
MPPQRRRTWMGFALFAALTILGLFVLHGALAGIALLLAMLAIIGACIYALRGEDPDSVAHNQRSGLAGWFGGYF